METCQASSFPSLSPSGFDLQRAALQMNDTVIADWSLPDTQDNSVDAVVAVSALEHNGRHALNTVLM